MLQLISKTDLLATWSIKGLVLSIELCGNSFSIGKIQTHALKPIKF